VAEANTAAALALTQPDERTPDRRRRKTKVKHLGRGYEYMDLEPDPSVVDSDPKPLGFSGTAPKKTTVAPAGLSVLAADEFGGGPRAPMMPGTWDTDSTPPSDT
ncbi:MAG TPA: hypothetical protein VGC05_13265, partial [Mycobacterium sp.]